MAVLAAFLAVATFLSNESVKEVITGETKSADTNATLETNDVKNLIASGDSTLLRVVGTGNPKEAVAVAKAQALETRINAELVPIDAALRAKIAMSSAIEPTVSTCCTSSRRLPCRSASCSRVSRFSLADGRCWPAGDSWASPGLCCLLWGSPTNRWAGVRGAEAEIPARKFV